MAKKILVKPNDVTKIAWAICGTNNLPDEQARVISNIIWGLNYPNKQKWKKIPQRPK